MDSIWIVLIPSPFANMAPLYEIDPSADTLFIVLPRKTPFAPWHPTSTTTSSADNLTQSTALTFTSGLRIKVSSQHLSLASRIFKNKLSHFYKPTSIQPDGRIHLTLAEGFDTKVVTIVLNAIHSGRASARVPKRVDLETLAQIAWFVDKFELGDALEVWGDRWVGGLLSGNEKGVIPEVYGRDLVLWLYVAFVFRRGDVFREVTRRVVRGVNGVLGGLGLPLRGGIIRDIEKQRQKLVGKTVDTLGKALDELAAHGGSCKFHCGTFLLGELVKTLHLRGVLSWPRAAGSQQELDGISYTDVVKAVDDSLGIFKEWRDAVAGPTVKPDGLGVVHKSVNGTSKGATYGNGNGNGNEQLPTPESSPVLQSAVVNGGGDGFGEVKAVHDGCDISKVLETLAEIDGFGEDVKGLELETELGYQVY